MNVVKKDKSRPFNAITIEFFFSANQIVTGAKHKIKPELSRLRKQS